MAEEKDLMTRAVEEYLGVDGSNTDAGKDVVTDQVKDEGEPVVQAAADPVDPVSPVSAPADQPELGADEVLKHFGRLFGVSFENEDQVKKFAEAYQKYPEVEEQVKILPELVSALEKVQNPLNFFPDETAYKIAQLSKDEKYKGKESVIEGILREDLGKLSDVKVIELAAKLSAKSGVRNPLRAEIKSMTLDPDTVIDDYDNLDDDDKDLLKMRADKYREELPLIGEGIKSPSFEGTVVEQILNQKKAAQEDLAARTEKVKPVAKAIISEIKELPVTGDFKFNLDLTPAQIESYSSELTGLILSGEYDINTEAGKKGLYAATVNMFKADYFDKAVEALVSHKTSSIEEDMRRKYNNETPLKRNEPNPVGIVDGKDLITRAAEYLVKGY